MKIKTDLEFVAFNDGVCDIYTLDEVGEKVNKFTELAFSNRVLGFKRHFAAAAVTVKIDAVIRIPLVSGVDTYDSVEISGVGKYDIEMVQVIYDSNPQCIDLTLHKSRRGDD